MLTATLQTLLKFLSWIPALYVVESDIISMLVLKVPHGCGSRPACPPSRRLLLRCSRWVAPLTSPLGCASPVLPGTDIPQRCAEVPHGDSVARARAGIRHQISGDVLPHHPQTFGGAAAVRHPRGGGRCEAVTALPAALGAYAYAARRAQLASLTPRSLGARSCGRHQGYAFLAGQY